MNYGMGTYTWTWNFGVPGYGDGEQAMTLEELLGEAAECKCRTVQICDNIPNETLPDAEIALLRARAEASDLDIHLGFRGVRPERLAAFLELAKKFGAGLVRSMLPKNGPEAEIPVAAEMLREALPAYEKAGVLLSLENHDRHKCRELRELIERVGNPNLGICLDTVNSFGAAEDPVRVAECLLPLANCLHIKDFTIRRCDHQMGFVVEGAPAGTGLLDARRMVSSFWELHPEQAVILELWTPYQGTPEATRSLEREWAGQGMEWLGRCSRNFLAAGA